MNKYYKYIIIILLLVIVIYFVFKAYKNAKLKQLENEETTNNEKASNDEKTTPDNPKMSDVFPLKRGSKNIYVKQLQEALINRYNQKLKYGADGIFGTETENALIKTGNPKVIYIKTWSAITGIPITVGDKVIKFIPKPK